MGEPRATPDARTGDVDETDPPSGRHHRYAEDQHPQAAGTSDPLTPVAPFPTPARAMAFESEPLTDVGLAGTTPVEPQASTALPSVEDRADGGLAHIPAVPSGGRQDSTPPDRYAEDPLAGSGQHADHVGPDDPSRPHRYAAGRPTPPARPSVPRSVLPRPAPRPRHPGGRTPDAGGAYTVGDPGRAPSLVVPVPDREWWDRRDTIVDGVMIAGPDSEPVLELRAASLRGLSHRQNGTVRQDEYAYRSTADSRYLVASVADGVSAGRMSHHAAGIVTRQGCAQIARMLDDGRPAAELDWTALLHELGRRILDRGEQLLRRQGGGYGLLDDREIAGHLAATALFAVVDLQAVLGGAHQAYVLALGDTSAWVLRGGRHWQPLQAVKNRGAEIASSATPALPMLPAGGVEPATRVEIGPTDVLVLMSDGVGDPLGDGTGEVAEFLAETWARPPRPLQFAAQVEFNRASFDDDRTALALWPGRRG